MRSLHMYSIIPAYKESDFISRGICEEAEVRRLILLSMITHCKNIRVVFISLPKCGHVRLMLHVYGSSLVAS